jgi:A/G-specific adenine glycosylase
LKSRRPQAGEARAQRAAGERRPQDVKQTRQLLLDWYRGNRRDLPWRRIRDPYAVWISEAMLQQTRVETVIPYWERFLARFPDVRSLAAAEPDAVLGAWAGLGYYSRARNLHRAARMLASGNGGCLPDTAEGLRELPGIGRYTAGAVASIAFDRPEPVVDGNVARVLVRLHGIHADPKRPSVAARLWQLAEELVRGPSPGDLNQALMELGALVCTPRAPRCPVCPLRRRCAARRAGDAETLPVKARRPTPRAVQAVAGLVRRRGRVLAVRRPARGLLGGLWELPGGELAPRERPETGLRRALAERTGLALGRAEKRGEVRHAFTHRSLRLHVFRCDTPEGRVRLNGFDAHRWLAPSELPALPQATLTRKALTLALSSLGS